MVDEHSSDTDLVRAFQQGERQAFDLFLARHQSRVYRLALMWLNDDSKASDATQEVFLRAIRGLRTFAFAAAPFTWLYRTQRLVCLEMNRQRPYETLNDEPPARDAPVGEALDSERRAVAIRRLVDRLPERQKEVVLLRLFEELSVRETAQLMRCREGTVKALLSKAKTSLRSQIGLEQ